MKRSLVMAAVCAAGLAFLPLRAVAADSTETEMGPGKHGMWKDLNLTADQMTKIKVLHDEQQASVKDQMGKMKDLREKIRVELIKDKPNSELLKKYGKETGDFFTAITQKRIDHLIKIKVILTKEQFDKLLDHEKMMMGNGLGHEGRGKQGMRCDSACMKQCPKGMKGEGKAGCQRGEGSGMGEHKSCPSHAPESKK
jgi:Spy/CpxP family protein refolding chaperone